MTILLTAFEPFGGETLNPALEAVNRCRVEHMAAQVVKLAVPVEFGRSVQAVRQAMRAYRPDAVLCVGQAGGRDGLCMERVALNVDDAAIPDNAGCQPVDLPIEPRGPAAYFSTLPVILNERGNAPMDRAFLMAMLSRKSKA